MDKSTEDNSMANTSLRFNDTLDMLMDIGDESDHHHNSATEQVYFNVFCYRFMFSHGCILVGWCSSDQPAISTNKKTRKWLSVFEGEVDDFPSNGEEDSDFDDVPSLKPGSKGKRSRVTRTNTALSPRKRKVDSGGIASKRHSSKRRGIVTSDNEEELFSKEKSGCALNDTDIADLDMVNNNRTEYNDKDESWFGNNDEDLMSDDNLRAFDEQQASGSSGKHQVDDDDDFNAEVCAMADEIERQARLQGALAAVGDEYMAEDLAAIDEMERAVLDQQAEQENFCMLVDDSTHKDEKRDEDDFSQSELAQLDALEEAARSKSSSGFLNRSSFASDGSTLESPTNVFPLPSPYSTPLNASSRALSRANSDYSGLTPDQLMEQSLKLDRSIAETIEHLKNLQDEKNRVTSILMTPMMANRQQPSTTASCTSPSPYSVLVSSLNDSHGCAGGSYSNPSTSGDNGAVSFACDPSITYSENEKENELSSLRGAYNRSADIEQQEHGSVGKSFCEWFLFYSRPLLPVCSC